MKTARAGRFIVAFVGLAALAAACGPAPAPAPPPPPPPAPASSSCASQAEPTPTPQQPVEYVAVVDTPGPGQPVVVTFSASSVAEKNEAVDGLADDGTVVAVEANGTVTAQVVNPGDDPMYTTFQWGPPKAGFPAAWSAGYDGTGVRIAIVDTGVRATHEDLVGHVDTVKGNDYITGSGNGTNDQNGHGTHVAGIAAAADNTVGVVGGAPGATIVPVRVLDSQGSGTFDSVAAGINWAATPSNGDADVINLSLGGGGCSSSIGAAVAYAKSQGVVVVAAAGNGNTTTAFSPASFDAEVIAVAATTQSDTKSSYSNFGSYVDIAAPGDLVRSTLNGSDTDYNDKTGTSMASPLVAAAVALYLQKCPGTPFDTVRARLISSATVTVPGYAFKRLDAGALTASAC